jgi:hypothetical protein
MKHPVIEQMLVIMHFWSSLVCALPHIGGAKAIKKRPAGRFFIEVRSVYFLDPPSNLIMSAPSPNDSKPVCA